MVNQMKGQNFIRVKQHYDDMVRIKNKRSRIHSMEHKHFSKYPQKRATVKTQDYFYHPLSNTPFTLGVALPRDYGSFRVKGEVEVTLAKFNSTFFEQSCRQYFLLIPNLSNFSL